MKKLLSIFLAALLTLSFAACGGDKKITDSNSTNEEQTSVKSSLELLSNVWGSYQEDEKFAAAGGDMSEENMTMDGPGRFSMEDATALDTTLGFPEASADQIDDAASLVHMMNANTFTCGVFHVKDAGNLASISTAIKDNIMQRQWMCGFPDRLVIVKVGSYLVSFFGESEIVTMFQTKLGNAYASAETLCDEPIA